MPVKYVREKDRQERPDRSYTPPDLFGAAGRSDLKRRIFLIYAGLGAVILAFALTNARHRADPFDGQPILRTSAVVTEKSRDILILQVAGVSAQFQPEPEIYNRLEPGDRVTVLYKQSPDRQQIQILEIGAVPIRP